VAHPPATDMTSWPLPEASVIAETVAVLSMGAYKWYVTVPLLLLLLRRYYCQLSD